MHLTGMQPTNPNVLDTSTNMTMNASWIHLMGCIASLVVGRFAAADAVVTQAELPVEFNVAANDATAAGGTNATLELRVGPADAVFEEDILAFHTAKKAAVQSLRLHIQLFEIDRQKMRELGVDFEAVSPHNQNNENSIDDSLESANEASPLERMQPSFAGFIEALEKNGLARMIADPVLVTTSGRPASIRVGRTVEEAVRSSSGPVIKRREGKPALEAEVLHTYVGPSLARVKIDLTFHSLGERTQTDAGTFAVRKGQQNRCRLDALTTFDQPTVWLIKAPHELHQRQEGVDDSETVTSLFAVVVDVQRVSDVQQAMQDSKSPQRRR